MSPQDVAFVVFRNEYGNAEFAVAVDAKGNRYPLEKASPLP